ncbi:hypothetical protein CC86DRAFT_343007 [Ophiobolus disseminans]|uniref:Aerobic respiration control sensor protein arcB n=1 Tax=Ophiobolus disseminans TaxID=1469910 RepID=A0A6A7ACF8_9PLEO|nr:hypothetical protein CC86DRAFT_343007 [Ophiobolus disseminans]
MDMSAIAQSLSFFGITQSHDEHGKHKWRIDIAPNEAGSRPSVAYFDPMLKQWRVDDPTNDKPADSLPTTNTAMQRSACSLQIHGINWMDSLRPSKHTDLFRNLDWAATPLGPGTNWSHSLRLYTHMLFSDSRAAAIYWGPKRIAIYNENLPPLIGGVHPPLMTRSLEDDMPGLWEPFASLFRAVENGNHRVVQNGFDLSIPRDGHLEERWWDVCLISLNDDEGGYGGAYFSWIEVTRMTLLDRRTNLVNRLGQSSLLSASSVWQHIYDVFKDCPRDISMAIMYSADEDNPREGLLSLEHSLGLGPGYVAAPDKLELLSTNGGAALASLLLHAQESSEEFVVFDTSKKNVHTSILENIDWLGFGEKSRHVVIIPLRTRKQIKGYIVLGLNPRRDFDADHKQFVKELARQLRELMTRVTTEEETQKREAYLLTELSDIERRSSRLAAIVPTGIYELASDGTLRWANIQFYNILGVPQEYRNSQSFSWMDYILPDDHDKATRKMMKCLTDPTNAVEISDSLRLKRRYEPPHMSQDQRPIEGTSWIMYAATPDLKNDGTIHGLLGSLTDISHLKWSEQQHIRNAENARRDKQRQEEFIDVTSHEMRNPLSAITQCADSVIFSLEEAKNTVDAQALLEIVKVNAEAAESILFCATHQRRIIDDVLTLGKLDSELLTIYPAAFRPIDLLEQAMQMFKTEFSVNMVEVQMAMDEPLAVSRDSAVYGDSSRLMQVLVNLLTNAIKFTITQQTRNITLRHGSSHSVPSAELFGPGFVWHSTDKSRPDLTQDADCGQGDVVYLYYAVADSGKGILPEFLDKVFSKFEQADRRTHTQYGGSGLGLYISRELTEMQGGRIGIKSSDGIGSTFAFYTKARRQEMARTERHAPQLARTAPAVRPVNPGNVVDTTTPPIVSIYSILLVEDNLLNQKVLAKQLTKTGCNVRVSNNGGEAIDAVLRMYGLPVEFDTPSSQNALPYFDCILMDWEMPVCDGLKATRRIREIEVQQDQACNIIIGVTANAREEQIAMALEAGMDTVVSKPFRVAELMKRIRELVSLKE